MRRISTKVLLLWLIGLSFLINVSYANNEQELILTEPIKAETIKEFSILLNKNYVFPALAKKMNAFLVSQLKSGAYENIQDPRKFAERLTQDLQSISQDKHLRIDFFPERAEAMQKIDKKSMNADEKKGLEWIKRDNYGFKKVEILPGNIGYIDFRFFAPSKYSKNTIAAVMTFVSHSSALIFDIRHNGGGDPTAIQYLSSYLFGNKPVHLNDLYYRPTNKTDKYWTLRKVHGQKMPFIPVYVLTSHDTFSGAEEFAYNLKNLKRGIIVGETTGGGAHPGRVMPINQWFITFISMGRAINPITKTNWEGTGVIPDVKIPADQALIEAQILALQKIATESNDKEQKKMAVWTLKSLQGLMKVPHLDKALMESYAGSYQDNSIIDREGKLYYLRKDRAEIVLEPISKNTFVCKDVEFVRFKFNTNSADKVVGFTELYYEDGHTEYFAKN